MIDTANPQSGTNVDFRALKEFAGHEFLIALSDEATGLRAFVAVHNRNLGMAHGGTRFQAYALEEDAIKDALNLSRAMTYKSALAGLPYGGAKGVIIFPENGDKPAILKAYAQKIQALGGLFHTGTDVGLTDQDVQLMAADCQYMLGVKPVDSDYSTSKSAATGVYGAIKAACEHKYGSQDLNGKTIGVKGLGKLGGELVRLLHKDGAKLIVADSYQPAVDEIKNSLPECQVVSPEDIHRMPMDVYAPCALGAEFTNDSVTDLRCAIIAGGANNQLASDEVGDVLHDRGIIYVPDYVANAGGLIFVSEELEEDGYNQQRLEDRIYKIYTTVKDILAKAEAEGSPTHRVADSMAKEIVEGAKR